MSEAVSNIRVRVGYTDGDFNKIISRILTSSQCVWFGRPKRDLSEIASNSTDVCDPAWFIVAVDEEDSPVAVAFYIAEPQILLPSIKISSIAIDPKLSARDFFGVAQVLLTEIIALFTAARQKGYIVMDVDRSATAVADSLYATGWHCVTNNSTNGHVDRFVYFLMSAERCDETGMSYKEEQKDS